MCACLLSDIDECQIPDKCYGICTNLPGKYLCKCADGIGPFSPNGCIKSSDAYAQHPGKYTKKIKFAYVPQ